MAARIDQPGSSVPTEPDWVRLEPAASWVRLEPVRFQQALLDGCWWPSTNDLDRELGVLVPVLDRVRGPVAKLLLSPAHWTPRPHEVVAAGRTIGVAYLAAQSPALMTVVCADGGSFTMRVAGTGPASDAPNGMQKGLGNDAWANPDGVVQLVRGPALR